MRINTKATHSRPHSPIARRQVLQRQTGDVGARFYQKRAEPISCNNRANGRSTYQEQERSLEDSATSAGIAVEATATSARATMEENFI